jgi:hypothetical protein
MCPRIHYFKMPATTLAGWSPDCMGAHLLRPKSARYPSPRINDRPYEQPRERNWREANDQSGPPMVFRVVQIESAEFVKTRCPNLIVGAVFSEPSLIGGDAIIKLQLRQPARVFQRSIVRNEATYKKPTYRRDNP